MSALKKYVPSFLLPTDEPQQPGRIYDVPLRRELFHKARPGNEYSVSASRNNSVVSERRRSSAATTESRRESWHPGMAFEGLKSKLHF
ncbi:uncharacterized protein A1O5_04468 [Cladophialophora psammophila CBS 110553]|uniref:Uncharacterized protein n=1 Tax=Cladophialophora psammophila CBS 110553 TaxID=1182543 RepID=W9X4X1_9EURO|nr:uncharacterized protein A1O5_04468 [Cladophialophora psammophila CBS 110553]EXJ71966.1 hypothetical protein A1O5_04468 [Cladophialophora psammophila CBS 110553]